MFATDSGSRLVFCLIIYRASQHSGYQARTDGEGGERVAVMEGRRMRKREMGGGGGGWRGPRDEGGAELCQHM